MVFKTQAGTTRSDSRDLSDLIKHGLVAKVFNGLKTNLFYKLYSEVLINMTVVLEKIKARVGVKRNHI